MMATLDPFNARQTLGVGGDYYALDALDANGIPTAHLPYSIRILLDSAMPPLALWLFSRTMT